MGDWEGLSMIFWDTSDKKIKMWGANSAGGNGQATMRVKGDELVWTNTVYDKDGKKRVSDFAYKQQDSKTIHDSRNGLPEGCRLFPNYLQNRNRELAK